MEYIGLDYHKHYTFATALDADTGAIRQAKFANTPEALDLFLGDAADSAAVLEATRCWPLLYELVAARVASVKLAHPARVKAIAAARINTDKIDSAILAHLLAADLIPEAHVRAAPNRERQTILRQRAFFVATQTRIKNRVHALIDRYPEAVRAPIMALSDLFGNAGLQWLRAVTELTATDRRLLDQMLVLYDTVQTELAASNAWVRRVCAADPDAQLLATLPGVGDFLAALISTELDGLARFPTADKLAAYIGLVPSTYASGGKVAHGRITKQGNKWLRWAYLQAAQTAKRCNAQLAGWYRQRQRRRGTPKATVALARRLVIISFGLLRDRRPFEPYRTPRQQAVPMC